jgi:hypothetical protein
MSKIPLKILSEPLQTPVNCGRVILENIAKPFSANDKANEYLCGSCESVLLKKYHPVRFVESFGDAEVIIQCSKCKSYNDVTPKNVIPFHLDTNLITHVKGLLSHATKSRNKLFSQFSALDKNDPRLAIISHLLDVASATFLNLVSLKENYRDDKWWESHGFGNAVSANIVPYLLENYDSLTAGSVMFFSFSLFESGIRRIVRAIDPNACSSGASEFQSIYKWLFKRLQKSGWTYVGEDPTIFLDLYRTFRNTLHNNGAFFPTKIGNYEITWKGIKYEFVYGQTPNFLGWEFNILLLTELISLNESIMVSNVVAKISNIS